MVMEEKLKMMVVGGMAAAARSPIGSTHAPHHDHSHYRHLFAGYGLYLHVVDTGGADTMNMDMGMGRRVYLPGGPSKNQQVDTLARPGRLLSDQEQPILDALRSAGAEAPPATGIDQLTAGMSCTMLLFRHKGSE
jgi:hypothetical protein